MLSRVLSSRPSRADWRQVKLLKRKGDTAPDPETTPVRPARAPGDIPPVGSSMFPPPGYAPPAPREPRLQLPDKPTGGGGTFRLPPMEEAVVTVTTILGDPLELLQVVDAYEDEHKVSPDGQLMRFTSRNPDGINIIEVWKSRRSLEKWLTEAGAAAPKIHDVHRVRLGHW